MTWFLLKGPGEMLEVSVLLVNFVLGSIVSKGSQVGFTIVFFLRDPSLGQLLPIKGCLRYFKQESFLQGALTCRRNC